MEHRETLKTTFERERERETAFSTGGDCGGNPRKERLSHFYPGMTTTLLTILAPLIYSHVKLEGLHCFLAY